MEVYNPEYTTREIASLCYDLQGLARENRGKNWHAAMEDLVLGFSDEQDEELRSKMAKGDNIEDHLLGLLDSVIFAVDKINRTSAGRETQLTAQNEELKNMGAKKMFAVFMGSVEEWSSILGGLLGGIKMKFEGVMDAHPDVEMSPPTDPPPVQTLPPPTGPF